MDITLMSGIAIIVIAYVSIWSLIIKSNKIIIDINRKSLKFSRDIEKELEL